MRPAARLGPPVGVLLLRAIGVRSALGYLAPGVVAWAGLYVAGIHPTLAGVLLGLLTPVRSWFGPSRFAETTHDCGELGNLAQSRRRFLLVARHRAKVPPFLYQPERRPLRAVGDVLGRMPLPGDEAAGPMHRMRSL